MKRPSRILAMLLIVGFGYGCKVKSSSKETTNWKAFHQQQAAFIQPPTDQVLMLDSVVKKLGVKRGVKVIDYGMYHGQLTFRLLSKEAEVLGLHWSLPEIPSPEKRFPQPWPQDFPGYLLLQPWQAGKIPASNFDLLIMQGRADEVSPILPSLLAQYCNSHGGVLWVNYQNLPQVGEAYCQGNTLTKPLIESMENAGFQQEWEIKNTSIRYLYMKKKPTN